MKHLKFKITENKNEIRNEGISERLFFNFLAFVLEKTFPKANPRFGKLVDNVEYWMLECEAESGIPVREIGIDKNGNVILKMPFEKDYGYWTDNNFLFKDFKEKFGAEEIEIEIFESNWSKIK